MLNTVVVINAQGELLGLPLGDISSGLLLKSVDGLDPVKATLSSSSFAQLDGEQYQSARREKRNIVLKIGLEPYYSDVSTTVAALRTYLYKFFMPKTQIKLRFVLDDMTVEIVGRIETAESPMFSADPEMTVSVICFAPDLIDPTVVTVPGNTTSGSTVNNITYTGSVETGVIFRLNVNRSLASFTIANTPADNLERTLLFAAPLISGDQVIISTVPGSKSATLVRGGVTSSILYGVSPLATWIPFFPGLNKVRVMAEGAAIPYTFEYTRKYGGL